MLLSALLSLVGISLGIFKKFILIDSFCFQVDLLLAATGDHPGLQLPGGNVLLSPHCKWLLTYGPDGYIKIRTCAQLVCL